MAETDFALARDVLVARFGLVDAARWQPLVCGLEFWVKDVDEFGSQLKGEYRTNGDVLLARDMKLLAHELLHPYEQLFLGVPTAQSKEHAAWGEHRYFEASRDFYAKAP